VALVRQGHGQPVVVSHTGQSTPDGWSTETLLLWGILGFATGGFIGGLLGWHACASMEVGKVMATQLPHLLPLLAA